MEEGGGWEMPKIFQLPNLMNSSNLIPKLLQFQEYTRVVNVQKQINT